MQEPHFLQTKQWADIRKKLGHTPVWIDDSLMLVKSMPKPFRPFGYMPQVQLSNLNWKELVRTSIEMDLSHIQLDPSDRVGEYSLPEDVLSELEISPTESIYYRDTLIIDLKKSEEELLSAMHKKHRYNIKVSAKHDVAFKISDNDIDLEVFLKMFFETVKRQNYLGRTPSYYRSIWKILKPQNKVRIATASYKGGPLVTWMIFLGDKTIYYPYGGSSQESRNVMAANGLVWGLMKWGKKEGYEYLDLWGIDPEEGTEGQKSHGFSDFKIKFGGEQVHYLPSYDLVINTPFYSMFKVGNSLRWFVLEIKRLLRR